MKDICKFRQILLEYFIGKRGWPPWKVHIINKKNIFIEKKHNILWGKEDGLHGKYI